MTTTNLNRTHTSTVTSTPERIVLAREEERLRFRRDLHDWLGRG